MKLLGKPVADQITANLKKYIYDNHLEGCYIVDFALNKSDGSAKYVQMKSKYASDINLNMIGIYEYEDLQYIYDAIDKYNDDPKCLGMLFQMPLPEDLQNHKNDILYRIRDIKDIDGLHYGIVQTNILPATAAAVVNIMNYYKIDVSDKKMLIIGQSNLVGKPLADYYESRCQYIYRVDINTSSQDLHDWCQEADIIISATGDLLFLDDRYIYTNREQILIDVGFGLVDGKLVGDIHGDKINLTNKIYTPVPGGVGPVTVASLFDNIRFLK